ncbi:maleylpyruvate isomerase family mycothiol-dependent enzyme [Saccharothrix sp.]|uniref:maleylpyruvate isomerase family mycothiol-dependent enzyme n=1 Tax=Saccharothrix sp. TaxID=1873460 RepID=UPI00281220AE|nr:maleylpyruvate isomerase family mycothiol-dependent enzyme [Saccharothrix sp.]
MTITGAALDAHRRLGELVAGLTDDRVREPSVLPGWTRGHVLAHIAGVTEAMARQAENEGTKLEPYPGGRPARDAAIEERAGRSAAEHRTAIAAAVERLEKAWDGVRDWSTPVAYRDGTLEDTAYAVWREIEIHTFDLGLGPVTFSPEFCEHAVDFLAKRVPDGVQLILASPGRKWTIGTGEPHELRGEATDLVVWLAGREPLGEVTGTRPELNPWP